MSSLPDFKTVHHRWSWSRVFVDVCVCVCAYSRLSINQRMLHLFCWYGNTFESSRWKDSEQKGLEQFACRFISIWCGMTSLTFICVVFSETIYFETHKTSASGISNCDVFVHFFPFEKRRNYSLNFIFTTTNNELRLQWRFWMLIFYGFEWRPFQEEIT